MDGPRWYVAKLKSGREKVAMRGLEEQGFELFYPLMRVTRWRAGSSVEGSEPVFPSYLFLRSDPDPASWRAVNNTRGISSLLGNLVPCPMPDREIDDLRERERVGLLLHQHRRPIATGDVVEYRVGTFVGLKGVCQWTRRERIGVLLTMLGAANVVVSPRDWLRIAAT